MANVTHTRVEQPEDNGSRILFDYDGVCVTSRYLYANGQRYNLRELYDLRTVFGPRSPMRINASIAAGAVAVIVVLAAQYLDARGWIGAGIVASVPLIAFCVSIANGPRSSELWCTYRGMTVQLLWMVNRDRYGQACRAIMRAQEKLP